MSDHAYQDMSNGLEPFPPRSRAALPVRLGDKVISLASLGEDPAIAGQDEKAAPRRNWASVVDLIQEAGEAIRITEDRCQELEAQLSGVMAQAAEDVRRLAAQLAASEQRNTRTEERLRAAEARAAEAEGWLVRVQDAVVRTFGLVGGRSDAGAAHRDAD
ncbi:MAG: hypothetical protein JO048_17170 [Methylobacteriaceae bacterium]|nr:hypothetical protein [Methylobacteriaceae bacterium]